MAASSFWSTEGAILLYSHMQQYSSRPVNTLSCIQLVHLPFKWSNISNLFKPNCLTKVWCDLHWHAATVMWFLEWWLWALSFLGFTGNGFIDQVLKLGASWHNLPGQLQDSFFVRFTNVSLKRTKATGACGKKKFLGSRSECRNTFISAGYSHILIMCLCWSDQKSD